MYRPSLPEDTSTLCRIAEQTGVFKPHEIEALQEVLDDYHAVNHEFGHRAVTVVIDGAILGFAYFAPTAMTERTWELWWIAIDRLQQRRGLGRLLLEHVESEVLAQQARLLLIETSSTPHYQQTRDFYLRAGYVDVALIPDFYADGDGKVIYSKRLVPVVC